MVRYILLSLILCASTLISHAQQALRKLPYNINIPSASISHPFISGDGESMIYLSNDTEDGSLRMFWTKKNGTMWSDGVEMNRLVNRPDLNFQGAFSLNYEGDFLIVSSRKSGLGGYELWYSELKNGDWTELKNFGSPINTNQNEASGILTTDGKGMYLTRCESMNPQGAEGCKLYFAEKKYGRWQEPKLLPEKINSYNPQFPRILADGETLLFSSKIAGGNGGFDIYSTIKNDNGWAEPVNLTFANTPQDDQFVSVAAKGRYLYRAQKGDRNMEIVQVLFPEEFKPRGVYRIKGTLTDENGTPISADLTVFNIDTRKRIINEKTEKDGTFSFVLVEGSSYDVSLEPAAPGFHYFSKIYELEEIPIRDRETLSLTLVPYTFNAPIINDAILFEPNRASLSPKSIYEIRRLASLMRNNSDLMIKITTNLYDYHEDSVISDQDLTEIRIDTVFQPVKMIIPAEHLQTTIQDTVFIDSLQTNGAYFTDMTDSLMVMIEGDSVYIKNLLYTAVIPSKEISTKTSYHNDRSEKEAEVLRAILIDNGVEAERIITESIVHENTLEPAENERAVQITLIN